jgi:hypothetical protein
MMLARLTRSDTGGNLRDVPLLAGKRPLPSRWIFRLACTLSGNISTLYRAAWQYSFICAKTLPHARLTATRVPPHASAGLEVV